MKKQFQRILNSLSIGIIALSLTPYAAAQAASERTSAPFEAMFHSVAQPHHWLPHWLSWSFPTTDITALRRGLSVLAAQSCSQPIAVWLPDTAAMLPAIKLFSGWQQHPLAEFTNCFQVQYYQPEEVVCASVGERQRSDCQVPQRIETTAPFILFTNDDAGLANITPERMLLPSRASVDLFAHELGHWLGFADEYAMSTMLAKGYCHGNYEHDSLNIVITAKDQLSQSELEALWQALPWRFAVDSWQNLGQFKQGVWRLGSKQGVGLYAVPTCSATEYFAWRPVPEITAMQYYDSATWPKLYLQLLRMQQSLPTITQPSQLPFGQSLVLDIE